MANLKDVMDAIKTEREYTNQKWGTKDTHDVSSWILFMEHHLHLARQIASTTANESEALEEIRKVTALGVSCMMDKGAPKRSNKEVSWSTNPKMTY